MDEKESNKIKQFNEIFSTNTLNKLKVLYSYLPYSSKKGLALYIKIEELKIVLSNNIPLIASCSGTKETTNIYPNDADNSAPNNTTLLQLCADLLPYCTAAEKEQLQQLQNLINSFENMQEMMQTIQLIKELMPEPEEGNTDTASFFGSDMDISQIMNIINMMSS